MPITVLLTDDHERIRMQSDATLVPTLIQKSWLLLTNSAKLLSSALSSGPTSYFSTCICQMKSPFPLNRSKQFSRNPASLQCRYGLTTTRNNWLIRSERSYCWTKRRPAPRGGVSTG